MGREYQGPGVDEVTVHMPEDQVQLGLGDNAAMVQSTEQRILWTENK